MPTTPISLEVEDIDFIPVLRVLQNTPGIARINFDLDSLNKKRGGQRASRNGNDPSGGKPLIKPFILSFLETGPKPAREIGVHVASVGHKASSAGQAVNDLRREGLIRKSDLGWMLTPSTQAKLIAAQKSMAPEQLALPAPTPEANAGPRKRGDGITSRLVVIAVLKNSQKPVTRIALRDALIAQGFSVGSIDGVLYRLKVDGTLKAVGEGIVQITAAGKKIPVPPEALPST